MEAFLGEIRMFAGQYAPRGWALCHGGLVPITGNEALFSILGSTYGGDGRSTFALPDFRGRTPRGPGHSYGHHYQVGERGGSDSVNIGIHNIPSHSHNLGELEVGGSIKINLGQGLGTETNGTDNYLAVFAGGDDTPYTKTAPNGQSLNSNSITSNLTINGFTEKTGGNSDLFIRNPYSVISFIICLEGEYPPRN